MKYAVIKELRLHYPVKDLCQQMGVPSMGYYSWRSFLFYCYLCCRQNKRHKLIAWNFEWQ